MWRFAVVVFAFSLVVLFPRPAHAYLDANTGSLLLQLLLGGVAGLAVVGKLYWHKFRSLLGLNKGEEDSQPESVETSDD